MDILHQLFSVSPFIALFITLSLGYLVGKITIGRFVLGGVAGTLLIGVIIGQFGVSFDPGMKSLFFALFIYAVGYQGGAHFFNAFNVKTINILLSAVVMTVTGLVCVIAVAWLFDLDQGTAAGLAAGGLSQSAIIGTAGDAISQLDGLTTEAKQLMQTHMAVGYAVTYVFGALGPIFMVTWIIPAFMKWDIRAEAIKLAGKVSNGKAELAPGEVNAVINLVSRAYEVNSKSIALSKSLDEINKPTIDVRIELIERVGKVPVSDGRQRLEKGDVIIITGHQDAVYQLEDNIFGSEVAIPEGFVGIEETRQLIASHRQFIGQSLQQIKDFSNEGTYRGIYITDYLREGTPVEVSSLLIFKKNDVIALTGSAEDINRVEKNIGKRLDSALTTDFFIFGLGMSLGLFIGLINFSIAGIPVSIGSGPGCLIVGLVLGWLRHHHFNIGAFPMVASNFIRDFGLAMFVGIVGLEAGPQALASIKAHGTSLLFLGAMVTLIPQILSFFFSYYVLNIKNPIEALGCIVGGRSANPGFAALMEKAGNATPVFSFTATYAVSTILLTLLGPIIVAVITVNATM
jgi:aspartate-alanine antiporter